MKAMPPVLPLVTAFLVLYSSKPVSCECSQDYQCSPPAELCCDGACTRWMECNPPRCIADDYCRHPKYCDKSTYRCTEESIVFPDICRKDRDCLDSEHCDVSSGKCVAGRRISQEKHLDVKDERFAGMVIGFIVVGLFIIFCIVGYLWYRHKSRQRTRSCISTVHFGDSQAQQCVSFGRGAEFMDNSRGNQSENVGVPGPPPTYSRTNELPSNPPSYEEFSERAN